MLSRAKFDKPGVLAIARCKKFYMMASTSKIGVSAIKNFSVSETIKLYLRDAPRSLRRSFLLNENTCKKVIGQAGNVKDSYVCEVFPGPGGLTKAINDSGAAHISIIENYDNFFPHLKEINKLSDGKIKFYNKDIFTFNMQDIFPSEIATKWDEEPLPNAHIIGNLPFAFATALMLRWIKEIALKEGVWSKGRIPLTLIFQKEIADRMVAKAMDRNRCRFSIMCQNWCHVDHKLSIPGSAFVPHTMDDVAVVQLTPRIDPAIDVPFVYVEKVLCNIFQTRVKMCKWGLETLFPHDRPELTWRLLRKSNVHPDTRPFAMEMGDFVRLCKAYKGMCDKEPHLLDYDYRVATENISPWRTKMNPLCS